jgi:MFS family permease
MVEAPYVTNSASLLNDRGSPPLRSRFANRLSMSFHAAFAGACAAEGLVMPGGRFAALCICLEACVIPTAKIHRRLSALNFALAGAREGFGPFLGVYLQARGFDPALTGLAMSVAGVSGLIATTPIAALLDRSELKRLALAMAVVAIAIGALAIVATKSLWVVGGAQLLIGVGDTSIAPILAAITLGIVGPTVFAERISRNEVFNHAGNAANALLAAVFGYAFGLGYVALAIVVMAAASCLVLARIDAGTIDHRQARGGDADGRSTIKALAQTPRLLLLAAAVFMFQTSNGALLPFLAQARTVAGDNPSIVTGVMTVVTQLTMVGAAVVAIPIARRIGFAGVMSTALILAAICSLLAAATHSWFLVIVVQVIGGTAMGMSGVAVPALVEDIMRGTGRAGSGMGAVLTAFGAGATVSPLVAGTVAQRIGFSGSFLVLSAIALIGWVIWISGHRYFDRKSAALDQQRAEAG